MSLGIPFEFRPTEKLICAGSLNPEAIRLAAAEDVVQVINLCGVGEVDWDEEGAVQQVGMSYHAIPISSAADLSAANVDRLLELLDETPGKTLLHCASSNRVGALVALATQRKGATIEQALAVGRSAGLKGLEPTVAMLLAQSSSS